MLNIDISKYINLLGYLRSLPVFPPNPRYPNFLRREQMFYIVIINKEHYQY